MSKPVDRNARIAIVIMALVMGVAAGVWQWKQDSKPSSAQEFRQSSE